MRLGKFIAIGNQKGGVGKSTITSLVANYMHNNFSKLKIVVIDADDLQTTLFKIRNEEVETLALNDSQQDSLYKLLQLNAQDIPKYEATLRKEYDLVFIDFPGDLKHKGVISSYALVDHLFVATQASKPDMDSTADFGRFYNETILKLRESNKLKTTVFGFFNRADVKEKEFKEYYLYKDNYVIPFMDNYIVNSVNIKRYISTIYKYSNTSQGEFDKFCNEIISIIGLNK